MSLSGTAGAPRPGRKVNRSLSAPDGMMDGPDQGEGAE
jgi:hypothetical protein